MNDQLAIEFGAMRLERHSDQKIEMLLGICAELRIIVRNQVWFCEPDFPVVELSRAVAKWLEFGGDLEFESMEAAESPFIWVRAVSSNCVLGAVWQNFSVEPHLPCEHVRSVLRQFAENVVSSVKEQLHINVSEIVGLRAVKPVAHH
jgi:hypothetical protein